MNMPTSHEKRFARRITTAPREAVVLVSVLERTTNAKVISTRGAKASPTRAAVIYFEKSRGITKKTTGCVKKFASRRYERNFVNGSLRKQK